MPRNDRSDSLSVRGEDDPRRPVKALEQEAEREHGWSETRDTGGVEHKSREDREGRAPERARGHAKEGGPDRAAGLPPDREPDDPPLAPAKRDEGGD